MSNGRIGIPMLCEWVDDVKKMTDREAGIVLDWIFHNYGKDMYIIPTQNKKIRDFILKVIMYWNECEADEE